MVGLEVEDGELCSGGHMREYGGGWVRSYSDRARTGTGGVLMSLGGDGGDDGVGEIGAGVGAVLARAFRRRGLLPKGANIVTQRQCYQCLVSRSISWKHLGEEHSLKL